MTAPVFVHCAHCGRRTNVHVESGWVTDVFVEPSLCSTPACWNDPGPWALVSAEPGETPVYRCKCGATRSGANEGEYVTTETPLPDAEPFCDEHCGHAWALAHLGEFRRLTVELANIGAESVARGAQLARLEAEVAAALDASR